MTETSSEQENCNCGNENQLETDSKLLEELIIQLIDAHTNDSLYINILTIFVYMYFYISILILII